MKDNSLKLATCIFLLVCTHTALAQKENLDDLVPYRKGKLWGLVHHDMKEFYKPVFDSIIIHNELFPWFTVFNPNRDGVYVAHVIYKGKMMWLTAKKELIPFKPDTEEGDEDIRISSVNQEGIEDEDMLLARGYLMRFYTSKEKATKIELKRNGDSIFFYRNDVVLPGFTCNYFSKLSNDTSSALFFLSKGNKTAVGDAAEGRLIIPFDYTIMEFPFNTDLIIVQNDSRLKGIMNYSGKTIAPYEYTKLKSFTNPSDRSQTVFVASKGKGEFFLRVKNEKILSSTIMYERLHTASSSSKLLFTAIRSGKVGLVTADDKILIPFEYKEVEATYHNRFFKIRNGDNTGFADIQKIVFIRKPVYTTFNGPFETKFKKDGKPYFLFEATRGGQFFFVDNFGKEFIAK